MEFNSGFKGLMQSYYELPLSAYAGKRENLPVYLLS